MASIINAISNGIIGLVDEAVQLTDVILSNKNKHGDSDSAEFVDFHSGTFNSVTYDPIAKYINEHFKDLTPEQAQQVYNAIKNGIEKSKILMEKCTKKDLQFRVIRLDSTRKITNGNEDVMINTGSERFDKAKEIFKSASDIVYLGCVMLVKNLSSDNGNSLEISSCSIVPSVENVTDPENYDGEDNVVNIYNKDVYVRFIPSTSLVYYTKPISEILSQFTIREDWKDKKDEIFQAISDATGISINELKQGGPYNRCISTVSQLRDQGISNFDSFKNLSGGFNVNNIYGGSNIVLLNQYFKFKTSCEETKYQITLFEMFLTGKSVNLNATNELDDIKRFTITSLTTEDIYKIISKYLPISQIPVNQNEINQLIIKQKLKQFKSIVVKNNKFIREFKENDKLNEGEEVIESIGEVFAL